MTKRKKEEPKIRATEEELCFAAGFMRAVDYPNELAEVKAISSFRLRADKILVDHRARHAEGDELRKLFRGVETTPGDAREEQIRRAARKVGKDEEHAVSMILGGSFEEETILGDTVDRILAR